MRAEVFACVVALLAAGCAPRVQVGVSEPIELNLNIRVEQEVRIKLDREVDELIRAERHPEVRPRSLDVPVPEVEDSVAVQAAKAAGQVGERPDGYLGLVPGVRESGARALLLRVNEDRQRAYRQLADEYGVAVEDVEKLAGARRVARAQAGEWVWLPETGWTTLPQEDSP